MNKEKINMKINKIIIALAAAALLIFTGCENSLDEKKYETEKYTVSGKVSFGNSKGAAPVTFSSDDSERTASTSFNGEHFSLKLYACKYNEEGRLDPEKKYPSGKVASNGTFVFDFAEKGRFKIFAELSKGGTLCACGNADVEITGYNPYSITIAANPVPYGDGKIQLRVAADSSASQKITSVRVSWEDAVSFNVDEAVDSGEQQELAIQKREKIVNGDMDKTFRVENGSATITYDKFCGGSWLASLNFEDALGNTVYTCKEVINIYPGFTTNLWYGTSPTLQTGNFKVTGNMVNRYLANFGTSPLVLYNTVYDLDYSRASYNIRKTSYYIVNSYFDSVPNEMATSNTLESYDFALDSEGNLYTLDFEKNPSDGNRYYLVLKSNRSDFSSYMLPVKEATYNEYRLFIDNGTNTLWVYAEIDANQNGKKYHFYGFNNIRETTSYTAPDYHYCLSELKTESGGTGTTIYPEIMAADQGMFYIVARNSGYNSRYLLCVNPVVNSAGDIPEGEGGGSYFTAYGATEIDYADMGLGYLGVWPRDILYQEGKLYILMEEKGFDMESPDLYGYGGTFGLCSRGGVVTVDVSDPATPIVSSEAIGVAKESLDHTGKAFYLYKDENHTSPLYTSADKKERYKVYSDNTNEYEGKTIGSLLPKIYAPTGETASKYFYGPSKFIAVKPKKLVIADEGYAFYTDKDAYCFKNVNRIVEIDLETFAFTAVNTAAAFEPDVNDDFVSSGFVSLQSLGEPVYDSNGQEVDSSNPYTMCKVGVAFKQE